MQCCQTSSSPPLTCLHSRLTKLLFFDLQFYLPNSAMEHQLSTELVSNLPLEQLWTMTKTTDHVFPKMLPHLVAKSEKLEGDGGAGTVRIVTLGDGTPAAGQKVKERVDMFDEATRTIVYSTIEGGDPRLKSTKFTIKFSAGPTSDTTNVSWQLDYVPVDASMPPPEHLKKFAESGLKCLDTYAKEHPEFIA